MAEPTIIRMAFHGRLLARGFWLYVWDVRAADRRVLYVGRTGDSSSPNAASPFNRIGQHLDARVNAKANSMARRLRQVGLDPVECEFSMVALGPLFPEQPDFSHHCAVRDRIGVLECALAAHLRLRGYTVVGTHGRSREPDPLLWAQIKGLMESDFPVVAGAVEAAD